MKPPCDPQGRCPRCGYQNGPGAQRCVRCQTFLMVPAGCTGACSRCVIAALQQPAPPTEEH